MPTCVGCSRPIPRVPCALIFGNSRTPAEVEEIIDGPALAANVFSTAVRDNKINFWPPRTPQALLHARSIQRATTLYQASDGQADP